MKMKILFATSNKHKVEEAAAILSKEGIELEHFPFTHREIRSDSIEEVAIEAAEAAYNKSKKPIFVEDTGLFIESLNGFPGTYSACAMKKISNKGVLKLMKGEKNRAAKFMTAIAYHDGKKIHTFIGVCDGNIAEEERGRAGFGYDPIFIPQGENETFAQNIGFKNKLSHRYRSLLKFLAFLKQ